MATPAFSRRKPDPMHCNDVAESRVPWARAATAEKTLQLDVALLVVGRGMEDEGFAAAATTRAPGSARCVEWC